MHARVSFYELGSASKDEAARAFEGAVEAVKDMEGSRGGELLVDTANGKALTITYWESEQALRDSTQRANSVREQAAGSANMSITAVEVYEVALEFD
jgi:heme-degrading monooxygenase HmoA